MGQLKREDERVGGRHRAQERRRRRAELAAREHAQVESVAEQSADDHQRQEVPVMRNIGTLTLCICKFTT